MVPKPLQRGFWFFFLVLFSEKCESHSLQPPLGRPKNPNHPRVVVLYFFYLLLQKSAVCRDDTEGTDIQPPTSLPFGICWKSVLLLGNLLNVKVSFSFNKLRLLIYCEAAPHTEIG